MPKVGQASLQVCHSSVDVDLGPSFSTDKQHLDDVSFMTAMTLVMLGNYAQTGHFGGPLSYTPATIAYHLGGPSNGGLRYDIRHPKHPLCDKFNLAAGHCVPVLYSSWMILYEAMYRQHKLTGDAKYACDPEISILPIDALGFRRTPGAVAKLLQENGLQDDVLFQQAKEGGRGIRALMGHSESTDVTNDMNGGPSGIGITNLAGKALFWDFVGAPTDIKIIAFEGEFAFTEGHAQELKTFALAQQCGKRLRLFFSYNNAGIDDVLIGDNGVINSKYAKDYDIAAQFASYGWNVFTVADGSDQEQLLSCLKVMEEWPVDDRRPMVVIATTLKGWWPGAKDGKIEGLAQITSNKSHPYGWGFNDPYFIAMAKSFENKYGVKFSGLEAGLKLNEMERLRLFKSNIDVVMSVLELNGGQLRSWITNRLLAIADTLPNEVPLRFAPNVNPFKDERLKVENLPLEPVDVTITHPTTQAIIKSKISLFEPAGKKWGSRRAISEVTKWMNYVTNNRYITVAADLSGSVNLEAGNFLGHYNPVTNPAGTRLKAGIQECCNAGTVCGLASQTLSSDPKEHSGVWGVSGTYGAFTPLFYLPVRIFSQQNQDSPFALGVVTILAGHSGPETAADARSHFGIFSPQVWNLFPQGQAINLHFWDYNDVAPGYFAAVQQALIKKECGVIVVHVARPDLVVANRSKFADSDIRAAAKGLYLIREFNEGPRHGTVLLTGSSATVNTVDIMDRLTHAGINVRLISCVSEELFNLQSQEYRDHILPLAAKLDCMVITTGTKKVLPVANLGPLTREYTMSSDWDDRWRTGGLEADIILEARLDSESIFNGIKRFADERETRLARLSAAMKRL